MKAISPYFEILVFLFLAACDNPTVQQTKNLFSPRVVEAKGRVIPSDSIIVPKVVPAGNPRISKTGKPEVIPTNINIVTAGNPKSVVAGNPKIITPGSDGIPLPKIVAAADSPFVAGTPTVWPVKDTYFKDNFPHNNSAFIKLRGLSLAYINCIMKDNAGNIWIGTDGGTTRFNGKFTASLSSKQGLAQGQVFCILQDKAGNIWFGSAGGISRYDGKYVTNYSENEGLASKSVRCMFEDKSGNLWFGCLNGIISKYDGKSFTHFTGEQGLGNNDVYAIAQDKTGNIWFGTGNGLYCYDGNSFKHYSTAEGLCNESVRHILSDEHGNLWLGMGNGGLSCFDGKIFSHYTEKEVLGEDAIADMTMDRSGNLWIATFTHGVCRFDGKIFTRFTDQKDLADKGATAIYCDNSGYIWVGGGRTDGLMRYNDACFTHYTVKEGLSETELYSIFADKKGNLWIGTNQSGVNLYDGKSFTHFSEKEGFSNNPVTDIIQAENGDIWFATWGDGAIRFDGTAFSHYTVKEGLSGDRLESIFQDKEGNIWFGTEGDGICRYDGKSFTHFMIQAGLRNDIFLSIAQDKDGSLWFATLFAGAIRYDGKTFTQFAEKEGLCNNMIYEIYRDNDNNMWFCTTGKGAVRYDGKNFVYITEKEGLKNNNVNGMIQDRNGNLCFACGSGLSILPAEYLDKLGTPPGNPLLFRNFNPEDGFSGWGCNRAICEDHNGTVWIGSSDRLTRYFPTLDLPDTTSPTIQLTGVQLYNENIPWLDLEKNRDTVLELENGIKVRSFEFDSIARWYSYPENLSLAYNNNYVTFTFLGITPKLSTNVTYKYMLEGNDENWSTFSSLIRVNAPYGNLSPGKYIFKVKALSSEGYWSSELRYTFTIRPPWWKTWWAYSGYILLFIGAIWFTIYSVIENQRKKIRLIVKERNRIARELHDDIGAELTRITMLSQFLQNNSNLEGEIREKLNKIAETGKKVLAGIGEIIWTMNPRKDNLDSLAAYIRRFVTEYLETNGIDISIKFPDEIPASAVSDEYRRNVFLVIKEAIVNITKYSKATSVKLSMTIREKLAEFEISDNGTGFSVKEKENWGNGLMNMSQRMKDIGGTFQITSEINQGTFIRLTFPVR